MHERKNCLRALMQNDFRGGKNAVLSNADMANLFSQN